MAFIINSVFPIEWEYIKDNVKTILIYEDGLVFITEEISEKFWTRFSILETCLICHRPK